MESLAQLFRNEVKPTWKFDDISHIQTYFNWRVFSIFLDTLNYVRRLGSNGLCDIVMGCAPYSLHTERANITTPGITVVSVKGSVAD
jgi:hypothetical protein